MGDVPDRRRTDRHEIVTKSCAICHEARVFRADTQAYDAFARMDQSHPTPPASEPSARERASSMVEYVGLGALATMLVTGIGAAIDSAVGDRLGAAVVRRLLAAVAGSE
jgi:hypothetical protein